MWFRLSFVAQRHLWALVGTSFLVRFGTYFALTSSSNLFQPCYLCFLSPETIPLVHSAIRVSTAAPPFLIPYRAETRTIPEGLFSFAPARLKYNDFFVYVSDPANIVEFTD